MGPYHSLSENLVTVGQKFRPYKLVAPLSELHNGYVVSFCLTKRMENCLRNLTR